MATLRDLHGALFPTARSVGGPPGALDPERADRKVAWVRVLKARVPAFDALEPGDLAIIPASALEVVAPGGSQTHELAAALARAHVPAVLLIEGEGGSDALDALAAAAVELGLTVLRLGRIDPVGLERSVIGFLVNRQAELDRRAADLESRLARLALLGRGLDVLASTIGSFLGRVVVIEGRRGDPIAVHAPADLPGSAAAVAQYMARPESAALRVTIPAPTGETGPAGRLVLLGQESPSELERIASERIAAVLALELARDAAVRQVREEVRRDDPLPADGPPWVVLVASQGVADDPENTAIREETRAELRLFMSSRRLTLRAPPRAWSCASSLRHRPTIRAALSSRSGWPPSWDGRWPCRDRSQNQGYGRPPRPSPARRWKRPTRWTIRRGWLGRRACRPTSCWATCTTCPMVCGRPTTCWRRS